MSLNQQIEDWLDSRKQSFLEHSRPFITLAFAQSLDGSITGDKGETVMLSGQASNQLTHQLRSLHQGILVGIETVLSDDPQLTVREWQGLNPQPIVLDSRLRMPLDAKLCRHPDKKCWVLTLSSEERNSEGIEILSLESEGNESIPLSQAMDLLKSKGIESLMVEGGARVLTEFLKAGLADAVVMTIAPKIIGGYKAVGDLGLKNYKHSPLIKPLHVEKLEQDLIVWGDLCYGDGE